jgi:Ca2+-binding EF-hand superfamily protein
MLMLKRYDHDRDGELTYTDIVDIYKPRDKALGREFERRLPFEHKKEG